jgi:LacI family transcriptional regulator
VVRAERKGVGRRRPTLHDVARAAGVSPKTVSRVVNERAHVSGATTMRVRRAIDELGFRPNDIARSLRPGQRSNLLGLVIGDLANPFYAHVASGEEEVARARGYLTLISSTEEDPALERDLVNALCLRRVDGMLMVPAAEDHTYLLSEISAGTAFVFIDRPPSGLTADVVLIDNRAGAREAVRHLVAQGDRRMALIGDSPALFTAQERRLGYEEGSMKRGSSPTPS